MKKARFVLPAIVLIFLGVISLNTGCTKTTAPEPAVATATPVPTGPARIAYLNYGTKDLYTMNYDGTGQQVVKNIPGIYSVSGVTPGNRIFYIDESTVDNIYAVNADGNGTTQVTYSGAESVWAMEVSPNGQKIAYSIWSGAVAPLFMINADSTGNTKLTYDGSNNFTYIQWSRDGSKLACVANNAPFTLNADGTNQQLLSAGSGIGVSSICWSADGNNLFFTAYNGGDFQYYIYRMTSAGAGVTTVMGPVSDTCYNIRYNADANALYYDSQAGGNVNIWKINPDGSGNTKVTYSGSGYVLFNYYAWD